MNQPQTQNNSSQLVWIVTIGAVAFVILASGLYWVLDQIDDNDESSITITETQNPAEQDTDELTSVGESSNGSDSQSSESGVSIIDPPEPVTDFSLPASTGETLSLKDLSGDYVLLAFGYTHCPDVCPTNLLEFRQVKRGLGDLADQVTFLFISVDPERDTPEFLARYLERYDPSFIGLSADEDTLNRIQPDFNLFWDILKQDENDTNYGVDHTATRFLLDPDGALIRIYSFTTPPQVMEEDIRTLIQN